MHFHHAPVILCSPVGCCSTTAVSVTSQKSAGGTVSRQLVVWGQPVLEVLVHHHLLQNTQALAKLERVGYACTHKSSLEKQFPFTFGFETVHVDYTQPTSAVKQWANYLVLNCSVIFKNQSLFYCCFVWGLFFLNSLVIHLEDNWIRLAALLLTMPKWREISPSHQNGSHF